MSMRTALNAVGAAALFFAAAGCGSEDAAPAPVSQTLQITATEYEFGGESATITVGETIRFELVNQGQLDHELQLLNADGRVLGQIDRLAPGQRGSVEVNFPDSGVYTVLCDIDDHQSRGQRAAFSVDEA